MIQVPLYFRAFNQAAGPGVPLINDYLMPFLQQHSGHGQSGNPGSDHSIFHHGIKKQFMDATIWRNGTISRDGDTGIPPERRQAACRGLLRKRTRARQ